MDGDFPVTVESLCRAWGFENVRFVHQLDYATSGVLCLGLSKEAAAAACRLFRLRAVQKEYTAIVYGHVNWEAAEEVNALTNDDKSRIPARGIKRRRVQYRPASSYFQMEQQAIRKRVEITKLDASAEAPTAEELALLGQKWANAKRDPALRRKYEVLAESDKQASLEAVGNEDTSTDGADTLLQKCFYRHVGGTRGVFYINKGIVETDGFEMRIDDKGKASETRVEVVALGSYLGEPVTEVRLAPTTGRRHQLRAHLAWLGHPIAGDQTYAAGTAWAAASVAAPRMMLHARLLELPFEAQSHGSKR
jgi:23S rRNA-/tRNA-specific pseudouridylate synthase